MSTTLSSLESKLAAFDPGLPLDQASTIPSLWYTDPEVYEAERRGVFSPSWVPVARADQLVEAGSFVTAEVGGEPLVVTRAKDGLLHAFSNVCRHKAAKVVLPESGKAPFFQCRYHGWVYDLCGDLKGTPEFQGVTGFERASNCLPRWSVAGWGPLVFVNASPSPAPLASLTDPFDAKLGGPTLGSVKFHARQEYEIRCNWKIFIDNYLDGGYHVNTLHPALAGVLDYSTYRTEIFDRCSVQYSAMQPGENAAVASVRKGDFAYYWWFYPNLMVNVYDGIVDTNVVYPLGPDRCRVLFDFYFADSIDEEFRRRSMAVAHQVQLEDVEICEDVQKGFNSRTYRTGRFSVQREAGEYHFHRLLAAGLKTAHH